jgi:hypothetical protein
VGGKVSSKMCGQTQTFHGLHDEKVGVLIDEAE